MKLDRYYGGCRPSPPAARGTRWPHEMLGMHESATTPDAVDRSTFLPEVLDQGQQGSCTGHGCSEGIWAALNAASPSPVERPSPEWCYYLGRVIDGNANEDAGSSVSSVLEGAQQIGFVQNAQLPYRDSELVPDLARLPALERLAYDQRILKGTARITYTGSALVTSCRSALAAGPLPIFGTDVDASFEDLPSDGVWPGCKGKSLGGHCMVLIGYVTVDGVAYSIPNTAGKVTAAQRTRFMGRNSWGKGWCNGGSFECDQDALDGFWDVWIVETAPSWSGTVDA